VIALVGPTATGKTALGIALAERLNAEIVCVDSMTVYRGMDVGTAKPTAEDRARVPHHLLDVFEPGERPTVATFQRAARSAIEGIRARDRVPMVTGGSGLYFRAAVDDLDFPPTDPVVRARLAAEDPEALALRLKERDSDAAAFIEPANTRRVIRALEVIELTGRPFSSFRDAWGRYLDAAVAGVDLPDEVLRARIRARLEHMMEAGLLDEVRALIAHGHGPWLQQLRAIGYVEATEHLDGKTTEAEMLERAARATWRLARRQRSWFRRDPRVRWFDVTEPERAVDDIQAYYEQA